MPRACIAWSLGRDETERNAGVVSTRNTEWHKLWDQHVWDHTLYKNYHQVMYEAKMVGKYIRIGKRFGLCVEKGSELPDGDVFQGNRVVDQNMDEALRIWDQHQRPSKLPDCAS